MRGCREGSTGGCSSITAITPSGEGEELESITVPSIRAPYTAAAREARYPQKGPNINLPIEQARLRLQGTIRSNTLSRTLVSDTSDGAAQ